MIKNPAFLNMVVSKGIISTEASRRIKERYPEDDFSILMHLLRNKSGPKKNLGKLWGDALGVAYVDLKITLFNRQTVRELPEDFARKNQIILIYQFGEAVTAALTNPTDQFILRSVEKIIKKPISPVFAFQDDIADAVEIQYRTEDELKDLSGRIVTDTILIEDISDLTREQLQQVAGTQAVVEFVYGLILLALREGASDIHIEPCEEYVRVRFRIDGVLKEKSRVEKLLLSPVISRLKILGNLDIIERRRPQDGRFSMNLPTRAIDLRVSCIPTIHGEKIVLRLLGQRDSSDIPDLLALYLSKSNLEKLKLLLGLPHGIFFVTGPTGSGKTTTLYSMIQHLNHSGINITTIEDPIEYKLEGISQVQTNAAVELDFASALRSFLRQDPDVMLVGEIRDLETAKIAFQAALTGHRVFATLHTNSAVQAVTRLIDIGVPPFIVASSLVGIMAQRLVRKICDHCKEKYVVSGEDLKKLFIWEGREISFYRGKGCPQCMHTGYSGRTAIHEVVVVDRDIRRLISQGAPVSDIEIAAQKSGYNTMRYDGIKKMLRGLTTIDEVFRVTVVED